MNAEIALKHMNIYQAHDAHKLCLWFGDYKHSERELH